ncbi:hypothetical protein Poli38472_001993 [Pythium oligandrum]|uniref:Phosphoribosyl-AMP cyclohydrolase domain-containing protein n=1 Tax=Pythium oligandrum TaxID=41045 RepID=A0A8K1CVT4_PYTOL|nr:hypothetical protein Poli38472_001993 [Pythium oligandrum]|eukprot:TMW69837.1 hypothetical protein Poli38472_001993 [Pythium oligandrum]
MLIPEVALNAAALQKEAEKDVAAQWEDINKLSVLSHAVVTLPREQLNALAQMTDANLSTSEAALKSTLFASRSILGPFAANMMESAITWLDNGIRKVLVDAESMEDEELQSVATAVSELPAERVILRFPVDAESLVNRDVKQVQHAEINTALLVQDKINRLKDYIGGVVVTLRSSPTHLTSATEFDLVAKAIQTIRDGFEEGFFFAVEWTAVKDEAFDRQTLIPHIATLHEKGINVVAPAVLRTSEAERPRVIDAGVAFVKCIRSDRPDGLFTTVVVDESGVALGLVYSSEESILAALESGRGVYYSRSRKGLWKKGESSGNYQELVQLDLDCDSDALRFMVRQSGAGFCHLNTRTCWGESGGLQALQSMLESRLQEAPAGSYTKRLFNDAELLRNKLVEEAQELAEAETQSDIAGEAADVMYFAMVRCVAAGVSLPDIEKFLDMRSLKVKRRPGNSKAYRIDAANEILKKQKK